MPRNPKDLLAQQPNFKNEKVEITHPSELFKSSFEAEHAHFAYTQTAGQGAVGILS